MAEEFNYIEIVEEFEERDRQLDLVPNSTAGPLIDWGYGLKISTPTGLIIFGVASTFVIIVILFAISSTIVSCVRCRKKRKVRRNEEEGQERVFSIKWISSASLDAAGGVKKYPTNTMKSTAPLIPA